MGKIIGVEIMVGDHVGSVIATMMNVFKQWFSPSDDRVPSY